MNANQRAIWIDEVLKEVLAAVIRSQPLREALVLKGAWILNFHLKDHRHSADIDATSEPQWVSTIGDLKEQMAFFEEHLVLALRRYFEAQSPVRFVLDRIRIVPNRRRGHPMGWDMIRAEMTIRDNALSGVLGLPPVEIEIAAPERYGPDAVETHQFFGAPARMYSLHRIAGEKPRAYLTSLPEYRRKMGGGDREFRVKDLHDLARIVRAKPTTDHDFWRKAANEFRLACESRYVDCDGPTTFKQGWDLARSRYEADINLDAVTFSEAERALDSVLQAFANPGVFPLAFPLPV